MQIERTVVVEWYPSKDALALIPSNSELYKAKKTLQIWLRVWASRWGDWFGLSRWAQLDQMSPCSREISPAEMSEVKPKKSSKKFSLVGTGPIIAGSKTYRKNKWKQPFRAKTDPWLTASMEKEPELGTTWLSLEMVSSAGTLERNTDLQKPLFFPRENLKTGPSWAMLFWDFWSTELGDNKGLF